MTHRLAYRPECDERTSYGVAKDDDALFEILRGAGYLVLRRLENGMVLGLCRFLFTWGLCVVECQSSMHKRYCYGDQRDALLAWAEWDGDGDPPGPWIKEKGCDGERTGPGARHQRETQKESA